MASYHPHIQSQIKQEGTPSMSNLVVIVFDDETTAFEMRTALVKMQKEYLIEMEDAVVVTKNDSREGLSCTKR